MPDKLISYHRQAIADLSKGERYYGNFADPAIFRLSSQKEGRRVTVAEDYLSSNISGPAIAWQPADNNEMSTRNAVSELFTLSDSIRHPITGTSPAPSMYFIKRCSDYPSGANMVIHETSAARHRKIGSVNGQDQFSDERADGSDHAYDPLRYYAVILKTNKPPEQPLERPQFSFAAHIDKRRFNRFIRLGGRLIER
jgi:hypothetical protein